MLKLCPMKFNLIGKNMNFKSQVYCSENHCAWFNENNQICLINKLTDLFDEFIATIRKK